jgi:HD-like signal output (HDOD) protein
MSAGNPCSDQRRQTPAEASDARGAADFLVVSDATTATSARDRLIEEAVALDIGNPAMLVRIAEACGDPEAEARDIANSIQCDAAFAATVLRLANSAAFARGRQVGDLVGAVQRLGFRLVGSLALATPGMRLLQGTPDGLGEARQALHRHAVRTGLGARQLAAGEDAELALAAGLVHNIGLAVVAHTTPEVFRRLVGLAAAGEPLREHEVELLGLTHGELGGLIAERWHYPLLLVSAIVEHDDPEPPGLAGVVRAADLIAREAGVGVEAPELLSDELVERLGIDPLEARSRLEAVFSVEARLAGVESTSHDASIASSLDLHG